VAAAISTKTGSCHSGIIDPFFKASETLISAATKVAPFLPGVHIRTPAYANKLYTRDSKRL
jgi:hypothetical protein